jgi:hypothetical protein
MIKLFLFKVEDHFQIINKGLIVSPGIHLEHYEGPRNIVLLLKKPDNIQVKEIAKIFYSFPVPALDNKNKKLTVLFPHLNKEDVPIGTEIWFVDDKTTIQEKHVDWMSILIKKNLEKTKFVDNVKAVFTTIPAICLSRVTCSV